MASILAADRAGRDPADLERALGFVARLGEEVAPRLRELVA